MLLSEETGEGLSLAGHISFLPLCQDYVRQALNRQEK
jgi:hypothetical protein